MAFKLFQREPIWTLTSLDDGTVIKGQFRPENLSQNVSGNWAEQTTVGLEQPLLQFAGGTLETLSFDARFWAYHQGPGITPSGLAFAQQGVAALEPDNIKQIVEAIKKLPRSDSNLGRPHVWLFSWTDDLRVQVVVRSVGGIKYGTARPASLIGPKTVTMRDVMFSIELLRYETPNSGIFIKPAESLVVYIKDGDTYEMIAKRIYGDAALGDALRRRNPDMPNPVVDQPLHVPPVRTIKREYVAEMQSLALRTGDRQDARFAHLLAYRGRAARVLTLSGGGY